MKDKQNASITTPSLHHSISPTLITLLNNLAASLGAIAPAQAPPALGPGDIAAALRRPIWPDGSMRSVFEIVKPAESVCLVVSDQTRKSAADKVLPFVLTGLQEKGCNLDDVFAVVATGIHRPPDPAEMETIVGSPVYRMLKGRIYPHDPDDADGLVQVGVTPLGHRVRVNRRAMEADRLILVGSASYHYHAGFGGGRKSLVPGLAARETIAYNHSLTLDPDQDRIRPGVEIGRLDGNIVSEEMLAGARLCEPDIIINTVLTPSGELAGLFTGDLDAAHRAACRMVELTGRIDIARAADFVVAIAAGAPDWIQAHKALFNAHRAIRPGGRVVLIADCPEGIGDERFRKWLCKPDLATIYRELRLAPEVNGQTALSTKIRGADAILVTKLSESDRRDLGLRTAQDLETAIRIAIQETTADGKKPTCWIMPEAMHTVPFIG